MIRNNVCFDSLYLPGKINFWLSETWTPWRHRECVFVWFRVWGGRFPSGGKDKKKKKSFFVNLYVLGNQLCVCLEPSFDSESIEIYRKKGLWVEAIMMCVLAHNPMWHFTASWGEKYLSRCQCSKSELFARRMTICETRLTPVSRHGISINYDESTLNEREGCKRKAVYGNDMRMMTYWEQSSRCMRWRLRRGSAAVVRLIAAREYFLVGRCMSSVCGNTQFHIVIRLFSLMVIIWWGMLVLWVVVELWGFFIC